MKSRLFAAIVCGISFVFLVSGCSSMLIKPAARNVKSVALVSVYMNRDFYDVKAPRAGTSMESILILGKAVAKGTEVPKEINDSSAGEFEALITYGIKAYSDRLEGIGDMRWVPVTEILPREAYRKFADSFAGKRPASVLAQVSGVLNEATWYTARDMVRVPLDTLTQNGKVLSFGDRKDPRLELAQLCKDLYVDAVAILEFDMAFKKPLTGADLFADIPAIPSISTALVLINKDGEVVVNSGPIDRGQGKRFDGKMTNMLRRDTVNFNSKALDAYRQAIDKSAESMKQRLAKELK